MKMWGLEGSDTIRTRTRHPGLPLIAYSVLRRTTSTYVVSHQLLTFPGFTSPLVGQFSAAGAEPLPSTSSVLRTISPVAQLG